MSREAFSIDTNLKETKSPLTADFIDEYLATKKKGELSGIGKAALAAAVKYGINVSYIVAHAALETGWGSSKIAKEKKNLFGWSAFDATPYASAKAFPSWEECIDFVMGKVNELYLTKGGKYFRKAPCLGKRGPGGYGMNANYATDPNWGASIARIADSMELAFLKTAPATAVAALAASEAEEIFTSVDGLLVRARSAVGYKTKYQLGEGGMNPAATLPGVPARGCDCSGYVCWCLGISRQTQHPLYVKYNSGWINTDAVVNDAQSSTGFFTQIDKPKAGCIMVYPTKRPSLKYGHIGIVTQVKNGTATKVIHCSSANYANLGDAIAETDPGVFIAHGAIFACYDGVI